MRSPGPLPGKPLVFAISFLAMSFLSCEQSTPTAPPAASSQIPATEKVFVVFEGPWAFAPDPKDPGSVVAIAPKTKRHRDLYVQASNQSTLASGIYDLSLSSHSGPAAAPVDPSIAQSKITPQNLQSALDNKSARYVIRLPKPEEYVIAGRSRSRLGTTYPPDPATEKDYATAVSFRYNVNSLNGFSLAGTPDRGVGVFNPLLLRVETPMIQFVIEVAQDDDPNDKCSTHSRESFHDLTTLLGLTLYVDFPEDAANCHGKDPQNVHSARATLGFISSERANIPGYLAMAIYFLFFTRPLIDCHAPDLILTPSS
jgi:hypothetical protein